MKRPSFPAAASIAAAFVLSCGKAAVLGAERAPGVGAADLERGAEIFERQCALCHGATGAGDGPAAFLLFPPARDFTAGRFKLASTRNGVPTALDLDRTIWRGMPGSAMPGFTWMGASDREAVAAYVRRLAFEGLSKDVGAERARERLTPGEPLEPVPLLVSTEDVLGLGKRIYEERCSACHGASGEGRGDVVLRDADDVVNHARDLTGGLLKGGARPEDLALRTRVGVHGTAMPARDLTTEEVAAVVAYLRRLLPPDANERGVRSRKRIAVGRAEAPPPRDPGDPRWEDVEPTRIGLAPLWWSDGAVLEAEVAGLHDGDAIALLVRWRDDTVDEQADVRPVYADAAAIELSDAAQPPFFGMGAGGERVDLWYWRASDLELPDLAADLAAWPHRFRDWLASPDLAGLPVLHLALEARDEARAIPAVAAKGMRLAEQQSPLSTPVTAVARWSDGVWSVVFTRALSPTGGEVALDRGEDVAVTFALWNGADRDLRGKKSIAVWHVLHLDE